jgi:hypothetical protein
MAKMSKPKAEFHGRPISLARRCLLATLAFVSETAACYKKSVEIRPAPWLDRQRQSANSLWAP